MATQRFDGAQLLAASISPVAPERQIAGFPAGIVSAEATGGIGDRSEPRQAIETAANLCRLGKGVGWGLAIEGFAALSLYGNWRLWHLWMS